MRQRGSTLIQVLMGTFVTATVMSLLLVATMSVWRMQKFSVNMPDVQTDAQSIALRLADALRGASLCTSSDSGCTLDSAVESASASGVTAYRRTSAGALKKVVYNVVNGDFRMTENGSTKTLSKDSSVALTFYSSPTYYSTSLTSYTPTSTTVKNLAAVAITASVTRNGLTARYTTMIRLRNSPKQS